MALSAAPSLSADRPAVTAPRAGFLDRPSRARALRASNCSTPEPRRREMVFWGWSSYVADRPSAEEPRAENRMTVNPSLRAPDERAGLHRHVRAPRVEAAMTPRRTADCPQRHRGRLGVHRGASRLRRGRGRRKGPQCRPVDGHGARGRPDGALSALCARHGPGATVSRWPVGPRSCDVGQGSTGVVDEEGRLHEHQSP